jgi:hypothetical protein
MRGTMRQLTYTRNVLNDDGKSMREVQVKKDIEVRPGYSADTVLNFPNEGH